MGRIVRGEDHCVMARFGEARPNQIELVEKIELNCVM